MTYTKETTGTYREILGILESFVAEEVSSEKPRLNRLIHLVEHSVLSLVPQEGVFTATFSVDFDTMQFNFSAIEVP